MGFGNGMNAPSKTATDEQPFEATTLIVTANLSIAVNSEEALLQETKSQLEKREIEFKNKELYYQKTKLLKVFIEYIKNSQ
jgi:hypothetical protein